MKKLNIERGDNVLITYNASNEQLKYTKLSLYLGSTKGQHKFKAIYGEFILTDEYLKNADIKMEVITE